MKLTLFLLMIIVTNTTYAGVGSKLMRKFERKYYTPAALGASRITYKIEIKRDGKSERAVSEEGRVISLHAAERLNYFSAKYAEFVMPIFFKLLMSKKQIKVSRVGNTYNLKVTSIDRMTKENELNLTFRLNGKLKKWISLSPVGTKIAYFKLSKKKWSRGLWVLDQIRATVIGGGYRRTSVYKLQYKLFNGIGLVSKIMVESTYEVTDKEGAPKTKKTKDEIRFSDYVVGKDLVS